MAELVTKSFHAALSPRGTARPAIPDIVWFLGRRLIQALVIVVVIIAVNFMLVHLAPGDAVDVLAGESGISNADYVAKLKADYGLDQSLPRQFLLHFWHVLNFDFGYSFRSSMPVFDVIMTRLPATLLLAVPSILLAVVFGTLLGVWAARRAHSWVDHVISVLAQVGYALPAFWLGLMLVVLFTLKLNLLPSGGFISFGIGRTPLEDALDVAKHMVLPVTTLTFYYMATYVRLMRASTLEVLSADFVRTARAKGLSRRRIIWRHVFWNALLPTLTMIGIHIGQLLGGAVVIEVVFSWPGIGRLAFDAIFQRDHNLLLAILTLCSILVVASNLLIDLIYVWVDPRIALRGGR